MSRLMQEFICINKININQKVPENGSALLKTLGTPMEHNLKSLSYTAIIWNKVAMLKERVAKMVHAPAFSLSF